MNINRTIVKNIALNFIGALVYALAINSFLIPSKLGEGGVTGLMTIFYYWIGFPPALTNLILSGSDHWWCFDGDRNGYHHER